MYYLIDLYAGRIEATFDTKEELVQYLKEQEEKGSLGGQARYTIFEGQELSTLPFWRKAFGQSILEERR